MWVYCPRMHFLGALLILAMLFYAAVWEPCREYYKNKHKEKKS